MKIEWVVEEMFKAFRDRRMYFDRVLREAGVFDRLEAMGVKDGDTIGIYDLEFEYQS